MRDILSETDWDCLARIGKAEFKVRTVRELLREAMGMSGRLGQAAAEARNEIDRFLAQGTGALFGMLQAFPSRSTEAAQEVSEAAVEHMRRLADSGNDAHDASVVLGRMRRGLTALEARFAVAIPTIWGSLIVDSFVPRLELAHAPSVMRRLETELNELERSLDRQHEMIDAAALRLVDSVRPDLLRVAQIETGTNCEAFLSLLTRGARAEVASRLELDIEDVMSAADRQLRHLETAANEAFVRRSVTKVLVPGEAILMRWCELQAVRHRPRRKARHRRAS